jgi:hypothetical protein
MFCSFSYLDQLWISFGYRGSAGFLMVKTAQRKKKCSKGRIKFFRGVAEDDSGDRYALPERKWCEPKEWTRTQERIDPFYTFDRTDAYTSESIRY